MSNRPARRAPQSHRGITLVELLVTLSGLCLLMALVLPAVQSTRESARKTQCLNHLRQLTLATQSHMSTRGTDLPLTSTNGFSADAGRLLPSNSPHAQLLPFLDQAELFSRIDLFDMSANSPGAQPAFISPANNECLSVRIPVFLCPSDREHPGATNYRANMGYGPGVYGPGPPAKTGFAGNVAGAFVHGRSTRAGEFRDGASKTVLFSEKIIGDGQPGRYTPWADYFYVMGDISSADEAVAACRSLAIPSPRHASYGGWTWLFGGWNSTWYNHILAPNSAVPDCAAGGDAMAGGGPGAYAARSYHRGGVNVALADGTARFVSQEIELSIWRALSTRAGSETIGDE
jgi:type II secretory pathway pseudopilin PulG